MNKMKTAQEILEEQQPLFGSFPMQSYVLNAIEEFAKQFKTIKTTCGKEIMYDDQDYWLLRDHSLFISTLTGQVHTVTKTKKGKKTACPVAKLILGLPGRSWIHYEDRNPLNLKRNNLSSINHQIAHFKQKIPKNNTSGYKGVSWNKFAKKWSAHIKINTKKKHLGYFHRAVDAAREYNAKAIEFFGENYAELNKIKT